MSVKIFTDGGCIGNPGPGGWGAIIERDGFYIELGGGAAETTNNRMEMTGAIEALKSIDKGEAVVLVTDSRYLIDGATKWIHGWKRKGWRKSDGGAVLNRDLWEEIDLQTSRIKIMWEHIKGHSGHPENERADDIANSHARGNPVELRQGDGSWIFNGAATVATKKAGGKKGSAKESVRDEKYPSPLYLSCVGGSIEEHSTWPECEARIKGAKGAKCKKVKSRLEHIAAITEWSDKT